MSNDPAARERFNAHRSTCPQCQANQPMCQTGAALAHAATMQELEMARASLRTRYGHPGEPPMPGWGEACDDRR